MTIAKENKVSKRILWLALIILAIVAVASVGLFASVSMNPQTVTAVSTEFQTETSFITSTETSTSYSTVTSLMTTTALAMGYPYSQNCSNNYCQSPCYYCGYNPDINSIPCLTTAFSNAAQCSGFLFQDPNGCIELVIPINPVFGGTVYQYYTLHNLPSTYPPIGSLVAVTGQLHQGYNTGPTGAACPGNYINVTSISQ